MSQPGTQPSILSFFQKQKPPKYAAPPSQAQAQPQQQPATSVASPPPAPPLPPHSQQQQQCPSNPTIPAFSPPAITSPHPNASIVPVTAAHIPALRRINSLLLPVNYADAFYQGLLDPSVSGLFSRAILWKDDDASGAPVKVIGGLVCRLEPSPFDPSTQRYNPALAPKPGALANKTNIAPPRIGQAHALYIQSLVLLAPYRGLGLVNAALDGIFDAVRAAAAAPQSTLSVQWVYAHVWTGNEEGLGWYDRRGFERDGILEKYYWKLQPDSAWVVKTSVGMASTTATSMEKKHSVNGLDSQQFNGVKASVTAAAVNLPGFVAVSTATATAPPSAATAATNAPPRSTAAARPPLAPASSLSFQNKRPESEWNDLPEDMMVPPPSSKNSSRSDLLQPPPSGSSSRSSSSMGRKKKDRAYPSAAFG
ncbi:hypothetical protein BD289DRAFT_432025 [Coniella lustricola]|uniref:N-acetyltransferase domain-containing protein n=1 Tax=Coniella lustricola TaxID=2025994 RepID=A0A2T3AA36_9PEZI|nr:hypothetical protein BD289DRAFT_432025 [Coniella lustricola]